MAVEVPAVVVPDVPDVPDVPVASPTKIGTMDPLGRAMEQVFTGPRAPAGVSVLQVKYLSSGTPLMVTFTFRVVPVPS